MKNLILFCIVTTYSGIAYQYFYGFSAGQSFGNYSSLFLLFCAIFGQFGALYYMRKSSSPSSQKTIKEVFILDDEEFHNDFSKVGSADQEIDVKPIDLSGNVFLHNEETYQEDLKNIGIDPLNKREKE